MTVVKITPWYLLETRVDSTTGTGDLKKINLTRPAGIKTLDHKALDHVPILTSIYSLEVTRGKGKVHPCTGTEALYRLP